MPTGMHGRRTRRRRSPCSFAKNRLIYPVPAPGAPRYFLPETCRAAMACCFFWAAALALTCFCAACLCTDFGDLSPITNSPFLEDSLAGSASSIAGDQCPNHGMTMIGSRGDRNGVFTPTVASALCTSRKRGADAPGRAEARCCGVPRSATHPPESERHASSSVRLVFH